MSFKTTVHPANVLFREPVQSRTKKHAINWLLVLGFSMVMIGMGYFILREII